MRIMRPKVLVVEDERAVADSIVYALRTDGCEPVWVGTGDDARAVLAGGDVSLVVLDVGLPDCNGFDLCREIRRTREVPVIFLTARSEEMDRVMAPRSAPMTTCRSRSRPASCRRGCALPCCGSRRPDRLHPPEVPAMPFEIDDRRRVISFFGRPLDLTRTGTGSSRCCCVTPGGSTRREQLMEPCGTTPAPRWTARWTATSRRCAI